MDRNHHQYYRIADYPSKQRSHRRPGTNSHSRHDRAIVGIVSFSEVDGVNIDGIDFGANWNKFESIASGHVYYRCVMIPQPDSKEWAIVPDETPLPGDDVLIQVSKLLEEIGSKSCTTGCR